MSNNLYTPPSAPLELDEDLKQQIDHVIKAQKQLILAILSLLTPSVLLAVVRPESGNFLIISGFAFLTILVYIFCFISIFKLAKALNSAPWLYIIIMLIPYINLIFLFKLNNEATNFLKSNNIEVGLFGAQRA